MAMRVCDGSDKSLVARDGSGYCPCGLVFDDANRSVFWPHNPLPVPLTPAQLQVLADALAAPDRQQAR